jgi:hypothetical protein
LGALIRHLSAAPQARIPAAAPESHFGASQSRSRRSTLTGVSESATAWAARRAVALPISLRRATYAAATASGVMQQ